MCLYIFEAEKIVIQGRLYSGQTEKEGKVVP